MATEEVRLVAMSESDARILRGRNARLDALADAWDAGITEEEKLALLSTGGDASTEDVRAQAKAKLRSAFEGSD